MKSPEDWHVYLVTDQGLAGARSLYEIVAAAVRGGVSVVQLREKRMETRPFFETARELRDLLRGTGIPLIINDRLDIALAVDAGGVHLGQEDMPAREARRLLGPDKIIGLSVNAPEDVVDEAVGYANYLAVSPVFHTATKEDITAPWGLAGLARVRRMTELPLAAIGAINVENAADVVRAGAGCVAVVSAIVASGNPEEATRALVSLVEGAKSGQRS
jgi:thiamine-phosphate pyrophosphorylase